ncbi:MAG: ABC transporter substrate-binding protein [Oscillospiraceae bacterium]|jgi:iron complex transport system substrate-binding protein|nr:ABC transporter substrate-binding protein [Oscillospiraceae bacterium]
MTAKKLLPVLLALFISLAGVSCAPSATPSESVASPAAPQASAADTVKFVDSTGREVDIAANIERIAPSGPLAQIVLYTLCPEKLVGFADEISESQYEYIDKKYAELPVFGNFYAETFNLEAVMAADPQVIIDIGEIKETASEDMAGVQERTGVPAIFIEMEMDTMISAYETLGKITGSQAQAAKLIEYIDETQTQTQKKVAAIPEEERISVYYGQDVGGLTAVVKGTVNADVIDIAGGLNVSEIEKSIRGGNTEVSMEQLMLWNPDLILFAPGSVYDSVASRPEWAEIDAVKNRNFFEVPEGPYNWMGRPPSVNRVLGIKWLSNLLYPEIFDYDMAAEVREFYRLFYHCDVTDEQVAALLAKSARQA